jgi:hypothetical protein
MQTSHDSKISLGSQKRKIPVLYKKNAKFTVPVVDKSNTNEPITVPNYQCCRSGMFIPDPNLFYPESRIQGKKVPDPGSRICIKEFKYF